MLKPRNLLIFACLLVPLSVTGGEARVDIDAILGDTIDAAIDGNPAGAAAATPGETADEIVSLMSRTLARYSTPPHSCETPRQVENQVQILGECRLGFRSRSEHDYLCGGGSRRVLSSRRADVDFSKDIAAIADIRTAPSGWSSLVLEFSSDLTATEEGDYDTNRWHITTAADGLPDLKKLAVSLMSLRDACENKTS